MINVSSSLFRILVGLRWWNMSKDDGTEEWIFESVDVSKEIFKQQLFD